MVYKLMESAAKHWRLLNGSQLLSDVIAGVVFTDGVKAQAAARTTAPSTTFDNSSSGPQKSTMPMTDWPG